MSNQYVPALGGQRLKAISKILGQSEIESRIGISRATSYNWYKNLPYNRAVRVAAALSLPIEVFFPGDDNQNLIGKSIYDVRAERIGETQRIAIFDGSNTGLLTEFLVENQEIIANHFRVLVQGIEGEVFTPKTISSDIEGYRRTILIDGQIEVGGVNAVIEPIKLREISFQLRNPAETSLAGMKYPFLVGKTSKIGTQNAFSLYEIGMPKEAIACCSIIPHSGTFDVMLDIFNEFQNDFAIASFFFDNLKRFHKHFSRHTKDGGRAFNVVHSYVLKWITEPDAETAVSYAIEAIPFCTFSDQTLRLKAFKFFKKIEELSAGCPSGSDIKLSGVAGQKYLLSLTGKT